MELLGIWMAALLTLFTFSFLFKDNPFYKFAEHLFVGVSAGYWLALYTWSTLIPKLFSPLLIGTETGRQWVLIIPFGLGIAMLLKIVPRAAWASRWCIAFVVGCTVGLSLITKLQANMVEQCAATVEPFQGQSAIVFEAVSAFTGKKENLTLADFQSFEEKCLRVPSPPDRNGDGMISPSEWTAFVGLSPKVFGSIDKNKDDSLSEKELERFKAKKPAEYPAQLDFAAWDKNADGLLSTAECTPYPGLPTSLFEVLDHPQFLFQVHAKHQGELESQIISEDLRKRFEAQGHPLSAKAALRVVSKGSQWEIEDSKEEHVFSLGKTPTSQMITISRIRALEKEERAIFKEAFKDRFPADLEAHLRIWPVYAFTIGQEYAAELDREMLSETLRGKFSDAKRPLSAQATVEVQGKAKQWRINDQANSQFFIVSRKREEIHVAVARTDRPFTLKGWCAPATWTHGPVLNGLLAALGVVCGLIYFFFSKEQKGAFGVGSKIGMYFLMVSFGASFGYTIMARISLLIQRLKFLLTDWLHIIGV